MVLLVKLVGLDAKPVHQLQFVQNVQQDLFQMEMEHAHAKLDSYWLVSQIVFIVNLVHLIVQPALDHPMFVTLVNLVSKNQVLNVSALQKLSYHLKACNVTLVSINVIFVLMLILVSAVLLVSNIKLVKDVF